VAAGIAISSCAVEFVWGCMDRVLTPSPFRWRIVDTTEILACAASRAFRFAFASSSQLLTVAGASSLSDDCSLNQGAPRGYTLARIQQSENFGSHSGDSMKLYETSEDFYTLTHTHQSKKIDEASEDFSKLGWASYQVPLRSKTGINVCLSLRIHCSRI